MISRYNSFKTNLLLESLVNESVLVYSSKFKKMLKLMVNKISNDLLKSEYSNVAPDVTFIDVDKESYISFITMRNAKKLISKRWKFINDDNEYKGVKGIENNIELLRDVNKALENETDAILYNNSRNSIRIGKLVKGIFKNKYSDKEIEDFVNEYKAIIDNACEKFIIVEGDDINKWYWYENYQKMAGTLGNSCMAKKRDYFDIYTENPEVCKLLILVEGGLLKGRALIWKINTISIPGKEIDMDFEYFMDRQYTINDSDVVKFRNYAKEKGWIIKYRNNHTDTLTVIINDKQIGVNMTVKVKPVDYDTYPYMDTFKRYDVKSGTLYNDDDRDGNSDQYIISRTDGAYELIESGYWSNYFDTRVSEENAVWSDILDDWLIRDRCIEITNSDRFSGWWPSGHEDVIYDSITNSYFHIDDCLYSSIYDEYIPTIYAIPTVDIIYHNCSVSSIIDESYTHSKNKNITKFSELLDNYWFKIISNKPGWKYYNAILNSLLIKNSFGEKIPELFSIEVFSSKNDIGIDYLSKIDADCLGYKIDNDSIIIDQFTYHKMILNIIPNLIKKLKNKIKNIEKLKNKIKNIEKLDIEKLQKLQKRLSDLEIKQFF